MLSLLVIIGVLSLISFNAWQNSSFNDTDVEIINLESKSLSSHIFISGILNYADETDIYYLATDGEFKKFNVRDRQRVEKGDPLFTLDDQELQRELYHLDLDIESHYLHIDQLEEEEINLKEQLEDVENTLERAESESVNAIDSYENQREELILQLYQLNMDKDLIDIDLRRSLADKENVENSISNLQYLSPVTGIVHINDFQVLNGDPQGGEVIMTILSEEYIVDGVVSEYDLLQITQGQNVIVSSDAIIGEEWIGKIQYISEVPGAISEEESSTQLSEYPIKVGLEEASLDFRKGFEMRLNIEVENKETLALPIESVVQVDDNYKVYLHHEGKAEERIIEEGIVTRGHVEVLEGITESDPVIINHEIIHDGKLEVIRND